MRLRTWVVAGLIENEKGEILLTQRTEKQSYPLLWELPGGKIELGEDPKVALSRELGEEIGATCQVGRIYDVIFYPQKKADIYLLVYRCFLLSEPRPIEVKQVRYIARKDLLSYPVLPADKNLIEQLATGQLLD